MADLSWDPQRVSRNYGMDRPEPDSEMAVELMPTEPNGLLDAIADVNNRIRQAAIDYKDKLDYLEKRKAELAQTFRGQMDYFSTKFNELERV